MKNFWNEKILIERMEKNWRGQKKSIERSIAMCYDLNLKGTKLD